MALASRTFRIFVSSTFGDLKAERDALQRWVFPRLRELCESRGARFQAIDLRWGVSDEASLDQRTMAICLDEIDRCRRVTPRPNFIVLLGDRYGWRPLPPEIPEEEFAHILRLTPAGAERQLLQTWYREDLNATPPVSVLQPREGVYADRARWAEVERELLPILMRAAASMPLEAVDRMKYGTSATAQEIARGALRVEDSLTTCAFSPDGRRIVVAGGGQPLKTWDFANGTGYLTFGNHRFAVSACAFSPDGARIVAACSDRALRLWDTDGGTHLLTIDGHSDLITDCAFSSDGRHIVSASLDKTLIVWDSANGREHQTLSGHSDSVAACAFSPDGRHIVSAGWDGALIVWDATEGYPRQILQGHADAVHACAFSPDGRHIVSVGTDRVLRIWDAATGREQHSIQMSTSLRCAAVHPWRPAIVCGGEDGFVYLFSVHGLDYGPLILTAVDAGEGQAVRCPICFNRVRVADQQIGAVIACPTPQCSGRLRINPFVIHQPPLMEPQSPHTYAPDVASAQGSVGQLIRRLFSRNENNH